MATIIDISGVLYSSFYSAVKNETKVPRSTFGQAEQVHDPYSVDLLRHLVLNQIRIYRNRFFREYGEIVLACDSGNIWRKDEFPYYKMARKAKRQESTVDWDRVYTAFHKILDEICESFPYKVIKVDRMEADDIIGTIIMNTDESDKHMIVSSDKDLLQLQCYGNANNFSHAKKEIMTVEDTSCFLMEHILRGDAGDGIPNVLSDDDTFVVEDKRQGRMTKKKLTELMEKPEHQYETKIRRNYKRNKMLIDLSCIPQDLQDACMEQYNVEKKRENGKIMKFFVHHKLKNLMSHRGEF